MRRLTLLVAATLTLGACSLERDRGSELRAPLAAATGELVNCIQTNRIDSTVVHDDYTIDFRMAGDLIYRNTLPLRCSGLGFEERFAHSSTTGQLCNIDTVTVLYSDGRRGATCGLGQFLPVRYPDAD